MSAIRKLIAGLAIALAALGGGFLSGPEPMPVAGDLCGIDVPCDDEGPGDCHNWKLGCPGIPAQDVDSRGEAADDGVGFG